MLHSLVITNKTFVTFTLHLYVYLLHKNFFLHTLCNIRHIVYNVYILLNYIRWENAYGT